MHHRSDALALVEVGAAQEDEDGLVTDLDAADLARVADDAGGVEAGQVGGVDLRGGRPESVHGRQPAGPEDQRDVVALDAGQLGEGGGGVLRPGLVVGAAVSVTRAILVLGMP